MAKAASSFGLRIDGHIVWATPRGGIMAVALPSLREFVVRRAAPPGAAEFTTVHALSGPDSLGRIAWIEGPFSTAPERKHRLKTMRVDGSEETVVFERPGGALLAASPAGRCEVGHHLALAANGRRVALLRSLAPRQMPGELLQVGQIEIWDLHAKEALAANVAALDEPMAWTPDGECLLYAALVPRAVIPPRGAGSRPVGDFERGWDMVPAIHALDVGSGRSTFLFAGRRVATVGPSQIGDAAWVASWESAERIRWQLVETLTAEDLMVFPPPWTHAVLGAPRSYLLVFAGPAAGAPQRSTQHYSPLSGPKPPWAVQIADLRGTEVQTIVPEIDPRLPVSFGGVPR